ncbi:hypothetical protein SESBI_20286 [Sesbania bispinosa]|nr:hypothetical protein SESBI_20286 [Sesbania bispinosa]
MGFNYSANSTPREAFYLFTLTLLSLLLPLSFLLLARLSVAQYYLQTLTWYHSTQSFPYVLSLALQINPCILYFLVSIITAASLIHGLTGQITTLSDSYSSSIVIQPRLYTAWILLCTFQVCVGLGIEGSILGGFYDSDSSFGVERSLLSRVVFFLGLHETTQVWCGLVVRPVVDDTVFGFGRKERWVERVCLAASLGTLWWWRLREDVETLVVMAEAKKEQLMEVGMGDFVGWCLYYVTVTIGMVRVVKGLMWIAMIFLCRRRETEISTVEPRENDDKAVAIDSFHALGSTPGGHTLITISFMIIHQMGYGSVEEVLFHEKNTFSGMELLRETNPLPTENGKGAIMLEDQNQQQELQVNNLMLEEINFGPYLQQTQPFQETTGLKIHGMVNSDLVEHSMQVPTPSLTSLELLRNYGSRLKKLSGQNINNSSNNLETSLHHQKMSTEEIIRVAGARYVQYSAHWNDSFCIPMHPYGLDLRGLSEEENRDVELAQFLLAAAEKVGCKQFERARKLLLRCQRNSSPTGNTVQRVVFHFAQTLRERIDKETGRVTLKGSEKNEERELLQKMDTNKSLLCHKKIPFNQVMQFTGIQTIVEHVASETKIHMIDLDIRSGVQCTALMQALAERQSCKVEFLKVTAIGFNACKTNIEETGKRLVSFAESLDLPFSYKAVLVRDMAEIKEDQFEIEEDEAVAVYSPYFLRTMIARPDCMEKLMWVIRNIRPSIMIVLEMEANHNSPSFVNRFIEALFFYSAFFDCLETCIKEDDECRIITEAILSAGIRNIVAMEGRERTVRNVKIDVWRRFFARYRMVESGFSESSLYQAELVAKEFAFGKFCTMDKNGKCLLVGWKGTPMHSISAWRFP